MTFKRGVICGFLLGATFASSFIGGSIWLLLQIGGENIAEAGAKIHAAERRYIIEASPRGEYTQEELSEPPAGVMKKDSRKALTRPHKES